MHCKIKHGTRYDAVRCGAVRCDSITTWCWPRLHGVQTSEDTAPAIRLLMPRGQGVQFAWEVIVGAAMLFAALAAALDAVLAVLDALPAALDALLAAC